MKIYDKFLIHDVFGSPSNFIILAKNEFKPNFALKFIRAFE